MQIVIEQSDFRRLSDATRREILATIAGPEVLAPATESKKRQNLLWRRPLDLSPEAAARLLHGLPEPHKTRLRLFAKKGGRVTQKELLAATQDSDMRVLSHFQSVLSRRLRRMIDDPEKRIHLIGWDFDATKWNADQTVIEDGIYYVTEKTTETLKDYFGAA
jgi:hypothetical protein